MKHHAVKLTLALAAAAALSFGLGSFADAAATAAGTAKAPAASSAAKAPAVGAKLAGCRDATGAVVKCPAKAATPKCRDKTTMKAAKCDAANSEPVPAKAKAAASAKAAAPAKSAAKKTN